MYISRCMSPSHKARIHLFADIRYTGRWTRNRGGIANERANHLKRTSTHALRCSALVEVTVKCFITAFARFILAFKRFLHRGVFPPFFFPPVRTPSPRVRRVVNEGKVVGLFAGSSYSLIRNTFTSLHTFAD